MSLTLSPKYTKTWLLAIPTQLKLEYLSIFSNFQIIKEYYNVRKNTIILFKDFDE